MTKVFFRQMEFEVPEGVYEPREDSFLAAEYIWNQELEGEKILDMGTGSGFLGIICAKKGGKVDVADVNPEAVKAAEKNAETNGVTMNVLRTDLFDKIDEKYDIIIFNAPYLPGESKEQTMEQRAWEGGEGGREVVDKFIEEVGKYLEENGVVWIVQSSLTGEEESIKKFEEEGFKPRKASSRKVSWEELQLIEAFKF